MRQHKVLIIGNGYVGTRVHKALSDVGYSVRCYDISPEKSDFPSLSAALTYPDIRMICATTDLNSMGTPDTGEISKILHECSKFPAYLTILESTITPGFCRSNWVWNGHFAYCPERIWPAGELTWNLQNTPRVLSANTPEAYDLAATLYSSINISTIKASFEVAELSKLYENTQRAVNILLAWDLQTICEAHGIEVEEVLAACRTKPFGYSDYYPGTIRGNCIPMAPSFLRAGSENLSLPIVEATITTLPRRTEIK